MSRLADRRAPSDLPERMDRDDQDPELLDCALDALARANRRFGGTRAVWRPLARALDRLPPGSARVSLLDVGTGGGEMARDLARRIRARGLVPRLLLADSHPRTLRLARRRGRRDGTRTGYLRLRAGRLPLRGDAVDFVVCATTLHHLERPEAVRFLREAERVSRRAWVVADLRRSWPAYLAVRLLSRTLWRDNPLPRRDGPRSVHRAFTPEEARSLLEDAGLRGARALPAPPFRLTVLGGSAAPEEP